MKVVNPLEIARSIAVSNASFERICLSRWLGLPSGTYLEPQQWRCSMIWSAYLGLPLSLAGVGAVLKLDKQKLDTGKDLIRYFCKPCRPTKKNGGRTRNLPRHDPGKWEQFKSYMWLRRLPSSAPSSSAVWEKRTLLTCPMI